MRLRSRSRVWAIATLLLLAPSGCGLLTGLDSLDEVPIARDAEVADAAGHDSSLEAGHDSSIGDSAHEGAVRDSGSQAVDAPVDDAVPDSAVPTLALVGMPVAQSIQGTAGLSFPISVASGESLGVFIKTALAVPSVTDTLDNSFVETPAVSTATDTAVHFFLATNADAGSDTVLVNGSCSTCYLGAIVFAFDRPRVVVDSAGGAGYTMGTPALTGSVTGTKDDDLYVGFVETENALGVFGAWSDSPGTGTPTDTGASASTTISGIKYAVHAATQTAPLPGTVGFAEAYLPAGNYAGGLVALTFVP